MNFSDGLFFLLLIVLCIPASIRMRRRAKKKKQEPKTEREPDDRERIWVARSEHIQSLSTPYEQGQEIVGRIGALCGHMSHDEMYEVFEHARRIVREREGFDREIH